MRWKQIARDPDWPECLAEKPERAWVYVLGRPEEPGAEMERCDAGDVAEQSGFVSAGQQYELQRSQSRGAPGCDRLVGAPPTIDRSSPVPAHAMHPQNCAGQCRLQPVS
jgi:hypothetical protein